MIGFSFETEWGLMFSAWRTIEMVMRLTPGWWPNEIEMRALRSLCRRTLCNDGER